MTTELFKMVNDRYGPDSYLTTVDQFLADCERLAESDESWAGVELTQGSTKDGRECYRDQHGDIVLIKANAEDRVEDDAELEAHRDILIDYDWDNQDEHLEWVATADKAEILSWVASVRAGEAQ